MENNNPVAQLSMSITGFQSGPYFRQDLSLRCTMVLYVMSNEYLPLCLLSLYQLERPKTDRDREKHRDRDKLRS